MPERRVREQRCCEKGRDRKRGARHGRHGTAKTTATGSPHSLHVHRYAVHGAEVQTLPHAAGFTSTPEPGRPRDDRGGRRGWAAPAPGGYARPVPASARQLDVDGVAGKRLEACRAQLGRRNDVLDRPAADRDVGGPAAAVHGAAGRRDRIWVGRARLP